MHWKERFGEIKYGLATTGTCTCILAKTMPKLAPFQNWYYLLSNETGSYPSKRPIATRPDQENPGAWHTSHMSHVVPAASLFLMLVEPMNEWDAMQGVSTSYGYGSSPLSFNHFDLFQSEPLGAASGDENGSIRLWELLTGKCLHKLSGHSSAVMALTCTPSYIVSAGLDERLYVWQRSKGTLMYNLELVGISLCLFLSQIF
jgi:WD40 repeat protein